MKTPSFPFQKSRSPSLLGGSTPSSPRSSGDHLEPTPTAQSMALAEKILLHESRPDQHYAFVQLGSSPRLGLAAIHLAMAIASLAKTPTLLVQADRQQRGLDCFFGDHKRGDLCTLLRGEICSAQETAVPFLSFLPYGQPENHLHPSLTTKNLQDALPSLLGEATRLLFLSPGPASSVATSLLLSTQAAVGLAAQNETTQADLSALHALSESLHISLLGSVFVS